MPFHFAVNQDVTLFSFSTAVWGATVTVFPQHFMLFMYLDGNASFTQLAETFPSQHGEWNLFQRLAGYRDGIQAVHPFAGFRRVFPSSRLSQ